MHIDELLDALDQAGHPIPVDHFINDQPPQMVRDQLDSMYPNYEDYPWQN